MAFFSFITVKDGIINHLVYRFNITNRKIGHQFLMPLTVEIRILYRH